MKIIKTCALLLVLLLALAACGGSGNLNGTWTRASGETEGFASITFSGDNIAIPGITDTFGDAAGAMGISYVYRIDGGQLVLSTSTQGVTIEAARFSFRQDGNSIFVDGVEYTR